HLGILLEDLRVSLAKHLRHPLIRYASSTQPRGIGGAKIVDAEVWNLRPPKSLAPNRLERAAGSTSRDLFAPSVAVGLLERADLAGYRNGQVYIRKSMHVPLNHEAVRDAMPAFFDLLRRETHPAVRVVLGHFVFFYIHPYMDGNGRVGCFLMNTMMASGGYPWTIIPLSDRNAYVNALEKASASEDIVPFADLLAGLVKKGLAGESLPQIPKSS